MLNKLRSRVGKGYIALCSLMLLCVSLPATAAAAIHSNPSTFGAVTPNCQYATKVLPTWEEIAGSVLGLALVIAVPTCIALAAVLLLVAPIPKARSKVIEALSTNIGMAVALGTFLIPIIVAVVGFKCNT